MKRTEKWYKKRLTAYFNDNYIQFEDEISFWPDPKINTWSFDIPSLALRVELVCKDNGTIDDTKIEGVGTRG